MKIILESGFILNDIHLKAGETINADDNLIAAMRLRGVRFKQATESSSSEQTHNEGVPRPDKRHQNRPTTVEK